MKSKTIDMIIQNDIIRALLATGLILLIPLLGRWPWSFGDFLLMGILIFSTGYLVTFVTSKIKNTNQRAIVIVGILAVFFIIWAQLAVGLLGKMIIGAQCVITKGISIEFIESCIEEVRPSN